MTENFEDLATLRLLELVRERLTSEMHDAAEARDRRTDAADHEVEHRSQSVRPALDDRLDAVRGMDAGLPGFPRRSRLPGGSLFHRVVGRSVRRDTAVLAERLDHLARATIESLTVLADHVDRSVNAIGAVRSDDQRRHREQLDRLAWQQVALEDVVIETAQRSDERWDALTERLHALDDTIERSVGSSIRELRTSLDELGERAARTAAWIDDRDFRPSYSVETFNDGFRGSRENLLLNYADVADVLLTGEGPVLDLGCGRGELVELVTSKGGIARGVELDPTLVAFCRSIYLDVEQQDGLAALADELDGSLGGVALIQVVEHLTPNQLLKVIELAQRKLRPGGVLVAETVNGTSPFVFTRSFYLDPTHTNPVHHEYLMFLLEQAGFSKVEVEWRSLVPERDSIPFVTTTDGEADGDLVKQINERILRLNQFLFSPQDYLVIARA